jgi:hypothetical protein
MVCQEAADAVDPPKGHTYCYRLGLVCWTMIWIRYSGIGIHNCVQKQPFLRFPAINPPGF